MVVNRMRPFGLPAVLAAAQVDAAAKSPLEISFADLALSE